MFGKKNKGDSAEIKPAKTQKTANLKKLEDLYYAAENARKNAYAPYSDFRVGAALLVRPNEDSVLPVNKIYTGVNIENGSYGATLCAERVAFAKAISDGVLNYDIGQNPFIAIAVSAGEEEALPCGICRQFMSEFAPEITVVTKADKQIRLRNLTQLLPESVQLNKDEVTEFPIEDSEVAADEPEIPEEMEVQEDSSVSNEIEEQAEPEEQEEKTETE